MVQCSQTLAGTYRSISVPQAIQAISPSAYSSGANHEGTLEVDDLCKQLFLCRLNNISICGMLSIQPKAHDPEQNSSFKSYLDSHQSTRLALIPS